MREAGTRAHLRGNSADMTATESHAQQAADACQAIAPVLRAAGIACVCLFGSRSRDDYRPDSDWDILLECTRPVTRAEFWQIKKSLVALLGPCSVASPQYASAYFVSVVAKDCIPIWS